MLPAYFENCRPLRSVFDLINYLKNYTLFTELIHCLIKKIMEFQLMISNILME
jgi:hypothetical protein